MTRQYPEDRRYESFEMRAAYDERYVIKDEKEKAAKVTPPKEVSPEGRTCTVRSSTGVCGKPAVYAFVSRYSAPGEVFAECAEHH